MARAGEECPRCGRPLKSLNGACEVCDAPKKSVLSSGSGALKDTGFAPAIVMDGRDPLTGDLRISVSSPGGKSETRISTAGQMFVTVEGAEAGKKSEPWAAKTLRTKLNEQGTNASLSSAPDNRGEDRRLHVGDDTYVLQISTTPSARSFWRDASVSSVVTQVELQRGVEWLRGTIVTKADAIPPDQRASMVLLVDARHAGLLAREEVAALYTSQFGSPSAEYGFASVWVAGPLSKYCVRLGNGRP